MSKHFPNFKDVRISSQVRNVLIQTQDLVQKGAIEADWLKHAHFIMSENKLAAEDPAGNTLRIVLIMIIKNKYC